MRDVVVFSAISLTGGADMVLFVLGVGHGGDTIPDYVDGSDGIGLTEEFFFEDLNLADDGGNAAITSFGEHLATLDSVDVNLLDPTDFVSV